MAEGKTFIERTQPINILDVIDQEPLERLLDSYCVLPRRAIAIYYPIKLSTTERCPITQNDLIFLMLSDNFDPKRLEPMNFPFCWKLWGICPKKDFCEKWDKAIVMRYYDDYWSGPKLFHCYMWLWEMTYPLYAGGRLVAVLYGGQMVVKESEIWQKENNWCDILKEIELEVVWRPDENIEGDSKSEKTDQIGRICGEIDSNKEILFDKESLKILLRKTIELDKENLKKLLKVLDLDEGNLKELLQKEMKLGGKDLKELLRRAMELDEKDLKELLRKATEAELPENTTQENKKVEKRDQIEDICRVLGSILRSEDINILKGLLKKSVEKEIPPINKQAKEILKAFDEDKKIQKAFDEQKVSPTGDKKYLRGVLQKAINSHSITANDLVERYKDFKKFGKSLQGVLRDLYAAKAESARHQHIHSSARDIAAGGDQFGEKSEEKPEELWSALDETVKTTLPDVKGYVLYKPEEHKKELEIGHTCIYDKQIIAENNEIDFENFCKQVFEGSHEKARGKGYISYDLRNKETPAKYSDLFGLVIPNWGNVLSQANVILIPLLEGNQRITGGLVCLCASDEKKIPDIDRLSFYAEALEDIAATLTMALARLAAMEALKTSLRVLGHEANQLNFGLDGIRKMHLSNVARLRGLNKSKLGDIRRDIETYFGHLNLLFKQATQAVSEPPKPEKTEFLAYREILFKWEDMYGMNARIKNLEFDISRTWEGDPKRPPVYGDKNLLEQLVYALVSNAVKYCHDGTKIYLDCVKEEPDKKESPHILTVTNYGREFDCENPFKLSTRGKNIDGVEGLGIGLYNAKRIANVHGIQLAPPNCVMISKFNVPLIGLYIEKNKSKNDPLIPELEEELRRLKQLKIYDEIVSKGKLILGGEEPRSDEHEKAEDLRKNLKEIIKLQGYNDIIIGMDKISFEESRTKQYQPMKVRTFQPTDSVVAKFISVPTWKIEFKLTIPAKEESENENTFS